jgi:outer membrane protein
MRTRLLIFSIFCTITLSQLGFLAQEVNGHKVEASAVHSHSNKGLKFGIVQFDALVKRMPATKKVYMELEKMSNSYQAELAKMAKDGQDKYENLQAKAAGLDPAIRKVLEQELMEIQQRIQTLQMTAEQELQKKQGDLVPVAESLTKTIKEYGANNQFLAIFYDNALVYSGDLQDITEHIAKHLSLPKEGVNTSSNAGKPSSPVPATPAARKPAVKNN